MKKHLLHLKSVIALLALTTLLGLTSASGQSAPSQASPQAVPQDNDTTRGELASFDRFMDGHPEIAEQLRRDPSLVKNEDFVRDHRDLQEYLQNHPGVREEISENPDRFMHQERRFDQAEDRRDEGRTDNDRRDSDRRDNDTTRGELANFDRFMDGHHEIAEQLRKDPSLVKNEDFVRNHPDLQEYLQQHPGVQEEISENPDRFMHQEQRYDRAEDQRTNYRRDPDTDRRDADTRDNDRRDNDVRDADRRDNGVRDNDRRDSDTTRGELANFDRFMDGHPEIAEQVHKDPSLLKNETFVQSHPALQEYLQQHPEVHEEITENPDRFMRQEQHFDRMEDRRGNEMSDRDRDAFGEFLGSHSSIAQDLSKDPGLANSEDYQKNHPDLQQYLKTHPGVQAQLKQNPQMFMKSAQPTGSSPASVPKSPTVEPLPKSPTLDPMPKP